MSNYYENEQNQQQQQQKKEPKKRIERATKEDRKANNWKEMHMDRIGSDQGFVCAY